MRALDPDVLAAWPGLRVEDAPYGTGLINVTARGDLAGRTVIVQRVHPAFGPSVHDDIEAVTGHLERRGLLTPRLIRTASGALCQLDERGRCYRVLSYIDRSRSVDRLLDAEMVDQAGEMVGRYHRALADLEHRYLHTRPGIHDVGFRARGFEAAASAHQGHALLGRVRALREQLRPLEPALLPVDVTPARHAHGDLKASNILFHEHEPRALCLVDLDTIAHMAWPFELGDAIRSWCNPRREDEPGAAIEPELYRAALAGYRRGSGDLGLPAAELELLPSGVLTIAVELALRFLTDALEERYFSHDASRFSSLGEHNLARASGQVALALSIAAARGELERITAAALSG